MNIALYVNGQAVELHSDEATEVTLQNRSVRELNRIFADYSKSFLIPATENNNKILQHWYEQGIDGLNAAKSIPAHISIRGIANDRSGIIELLGVTLQNGQPKDYEVVFYGITRQIGDLFGENKLGQIDWSDYNHVLSYDNVRDSWDGSLKGGDILYPIFDLERGFIHTASSINPTQNIGSVFGAVRLDELRPALLIREMFKECFTAIGISVTGGWLTDDRLDNLYVMPMEKAGKHKTGTDATFNVENSGAMTITGLNGTNVKITSFDIKGYDPNGYVSLPTQLYTAPYDGNYEFSFIGFPLLVNTSGNDLDIGLLINGVVAATQTVTPIAGGPAVSAIFNVTLQASDEVWLYMRGDSGMTSITFDAFSLFRCTSAPEGGLGLSIDAKEIMPDMTIKDFVQSCVDAFNLVFTPINSRQISVDFLSDYYDGQNIIDITPYVDTSTYKFTKVDIPKRIAFGHDQKKDIANEDFVNINTREYGSVEYVADNDFAQDSLDIKTKFQIMVPDSVYSYDSNGNVTGATELELIKALDASQKPVQVPLLMFYYVGKEAITSGWYLYDSIDTASANKQLQSFWPYCRTYNAKPCNTNSYSLAFGFEPVIDEANEDSAVNTLLQMNYADYLTNTYYKKNRRLSIDAVLPERIAYEIKQYSIIIVNGQSYIIDQMTFKSNSAKISFVLEGWIVNSDFNRRVISSSGNTIRIQGLSSDDTNYDGYNIGANTENGKITNRLPVNTDVINVPQRLINYTDAKSISDRNRANHTGTQVAATISDFSTAVNQTKMQAIERDSNFTINTGYNMTTVRCYDTCTEITLGTGLDGIYFELFNDTSETITLTGVASGATSLNAGEYAIVRGLINVGWVVKQL